MKHLGAPSGHVLPLMECSLSLAGQAQWTGQPCQSPQNYFGAARNVPGGPLNFFPSPRFVPGWPRKVSGAPLKFDGGPRNLPGAALIVFGVPRNLPGGPRNQFGAQQNVESPIKRGITPTTATNGGLKHEYA